MSVTPTAAQAQLMADYGWHVFPCRPGDKRPAVPNGQNQATTDIGQVLEWWSRWPDANIGIHCRPSGLYVIDLDRHGGPDGVVAWRNLCRANGAQRTRMASTPSGGFHLYYRGGEGLSNTAGKLAPGIDTRGNGYVVAPPSVTPAGTYAWCEPRLGIAPLPAWVADSLSTRVPAARPAARPVARPAAGPSIYARVSALGDAIATAPDGRGNSTCAEVAFKVGQYVGAGQLTHEEAFAELRGSLSSWSFRNPSDERSMLKTIDSQLRNGAASPRAWTE